MTGSGGLPLLFLDVDGPLLPFGPATGPGGIHPTYPAGPIPPGSRAHPLLPFGPATGPGGIHPTYPAGPIPPGYRAHPLLARIDPGPGRVREVASSARRARPAASGACSRRAGPRPLYWTYRGLGPVRRECVPGVAGQTRLCGHAPGPRLAALGCELVWATTWTHEANEIVAPRLGLPPLPVAPWPEPSAEDERDERAGLHWKTRPLVGLAAGRAFVWVDDEIGAPDRRWVAAHHGGRALLHRVDPGRGLTDTDFRQLDAWLRTV